MKHFYLVLSLLMLQLSVAQEIDLSYYLPQDISFDPGIPKPKDIIGHEVGEWHVTHDKLVRYMEVLAEKSPRISLENRGTTYEGRPLLLLTITSPSNHARLEELRMQHLEATNTGTFDSKAPAVLYQGFSIHGNEPSGSNAALAVAYYLAAAQGAEIESLLQNLVILFDPSFNPDGLQRFSTWANMHRNSTVNPDPNDREYDEVWPGGRFNHYWFDMNRDWLPVQLAESKVRLQTYHKWLPNILTDHHEMGTNSTFFFQPGEPKRVHPLTPKLNQELTKKIGTYHAKALDKIGSLYYSEENYDDYYYGKGSTFPDINGGIGILFEQGSSRGHAQESDNGILTFPFTIRNQFTTALSTFQAASEMREELLRFQADFFSERRKEAASNKQSAWIFGDTKDRAKSYHLAEILKKHQIEIYQPNSELNIDGKVFRPGSSYVVPRNQKNFKIIEAIFEKRTTFEDSLFYDISGWTYPLAFNLDYTQSSKIDMKSLSKAELQLPQGEVTGTSAYAYLLEWHEYYAPKALNALLEKGVRVKVARTPFSLEGKTFDYGTLMIPAEGQELNRSELHQALTEVAASSHLTIHAVGTGLTEGIDLGSNNFERIKTKKIAVLTGEGINPQDAGEIWHLFDQRYQITLTKLDTRNFNATDLSRYTTLIIPGIYGNNLKGIDAKKLEEWVKQGGTLIGYRNALKWMQSGGLLDVQFRKSEEKHPAKNIPFDQKENFQGAQETSGAIFEAKTDRSHPVNFGYTNNTLAMFRNTNLFLEPAENSFDNPIRYTENPLLSGYISEENLELLKGSVPFATQKLGRGRVIGFTDNTNFRAFWYGTNKLLMNSIFFADFM